MEQPQTFDTPLTILHFNDCYNISERKGDICGGCPRFVTLLKQYAQPKLTLFSGDLWSPSKHTAMFHGEQLVVPINECSVDVACLGNHDFDLGVEQLQHLNSRTNFPWLLSNLTSINGSRFGGSLPYHMITKSGYKVGVIGLIEYDWVTTLNCLDVDDIIYEDFVECGTRLAHQLREDYSCDLVIALTHMRIPNDRRLAALVPGIDLVLGGHDHLFAIEKVEQVLVVKSGTDFLCISEIQIELLTDASTATEHKETVDDDNVKTGHAYNYVLNSKWRVTVTKRDVTQSLVPDAAIVEHSKVYDSKLSAKLKEPLFICDVPLETKFAVVRSQECAVGNLIADVMRKEVSADCAIYNAGSIRSDCSYNQKIYTVGDLEAIKPYDEKIFLIEVTHEQIKQALENSVSKLPALEGRFCQVSHIYFEFDVSLPAGQRINPATLEINKFKYNPTQIARMAVINYAHAGKDGFNCLRTTKLLSASENVRTMSEIMLEFFMMMQKPEYIDEFRIYQINQEELTQNFIRLRIQQKVDTNKQFAEAAKKWIEDDDEQIKRRKQSLDEPEPSPHPKVLSSKDYSDEPQELLKTISKGIKEYSDSQSTIKLLTRFNIEMLLSKKAVLSMECLIRLRKYQLFVGLEKGPHKAILPKIRPGVDGRIRSTNWGSVQKE